MLSSTHSMELQRNVRAKAVLILVGSAVVWAQAPAPYFPARNDWQHRSAGQLGMDEAKVNEAIAFHKANESKTPKDLRLSHDLSFAREAYGEPLGPFFERGGASGVIVRHGYIAAEWGEPLRTDMTFSVTKSFVSSVVGVAHDQGLIRDLNDRVSRYVPGEYFAGDGHNSRITWDHLLRQTSDWEGTLWSKPDWADRPPKDMPLDDYRKRVHAEPGTTWKYNDVRVNLLAYAVMQVWRRPLPQVLKEFVMDPIGASSTWRWHGYENSWVTLDGVRMQASTGGGHWGGGMVISSEDMARFGLLTLNRGKWNGKQVLSEQWVKMALTPTGPNPGYGFMNWFLNTDKKMLKSAPANVFCHVGNGANIIYVDPDLDLVAVIRWIDQGAAYANLDKFVALLRASASR